MEKYAIVADTIIGILKKYPMVKQFISKETILFAYENANKATEAWLKERDPNEPGREKKMQAEARLKAIMDRVFNRQKQAILSRLQAIQMASTKKITEMDDPELYDWGDDEITLINELYNMYIEGFELASTQPGIIIDWTIANAKASEWARKYSGKLVKGINSTTREIISSAVDDFINTTGFTMGQVVARLPFDSRRSWMVAITEVTRAYAESGMATGQRIQDQFPGLKVYKTWYTNNDEQVCDICGGFHGRSVLLDVPFDFEILNPPAHPNCRCWMSVRTEIGMLGQI